MNITDFVKYLDEHRADFEYAIAEYDGKDGVMVKNNRFDTETHFTNDAIKKNSLELLLTMTTHGKNVEHVTRVTGFFSKVESWNRGKLGELKERKRNALGRAA